MNNIASQYLTLLEADGLLMNYLVIVVGGLIGGVASKDHQEMDRVPYFVYWMLVALLATLAVLGFGFLILSAYQSEWMWIVALTAASVAFTIGCFTGRYAVQRSRSAFGTGKLGCLAFIPIVNILLFVWPPEDKRSPRRIRFAKPMTGSVGFALGSFLFLATIFVAHLTEGIVADVAARSSVNDGFQESTISQLVETHGLEMTLRIMSSEIETPITINATIDLVRVEAVGTQLRRIYTVSSPNAGSIADSASFIVGRICDARPLAPILRAGGSVREVYYSPAGSELGAATVMHGDCGV